MKSFILNKNRLICFSVFSFFAMAFINQAFAVGGLDREEPFNLFRAAQWIAMASGSLAILWGLYKYSLKHGELEEMLRFVIVGGCVAVLPWFFG